MDPNATMRGNNSAVPPRRKTNANDSRKEAELAKHKEERISARKERVKVLSETLIRKINQLTDTNMDERAIKTFQLKLQVPDLLSRLLGPNGNGLMAVLTDCRHTPVVISNRKKLKTSNWSHLESTFCIL